MRTLSILFPERHTPDTASPGFPAVKIQYHKVEILISVKLFQVLSLSPFNLGEDVLLGGVPGADLPVEQEEEDGSPVLLRLELQPDLHGQQVVGCLREITAYCAFVLTATLVC